MLYLWKLEVDTGREAELAGTQQNDDSLDLADGRLTAITLCHDLIRQHGMA